MQHPDEGTIHAWLDGALPPAEARAIEAHAAGCSECAAAIAEARGLVAASSRILSALDSVPGGVLPAAVPPQGASGGTVAGGAMRRRGASWWRSTPLRAAAAIVLVGSVSWLATRDRVQQQASMAPSIVMAPAEERMIAADTMVSAPAAAARAESKVAAPVAPPALEQPRASFAAPRVRQEVPVREQSANVAAQARSMDMAVTRPASPDASTGSVSSGSAGSGSASSGSAGSGSASSGSMAPGAVGGGSASAGRAGAVTDSTAPAGRALLAEQRVAAPMPSTIPSPIPSPMASAMAKSAAAPAAKTNAKLAPALMPGSDALERLLGCYVLESSEARAQANASKPLSSLLPARIELRADRADDLDPTAMVLRAAPGEPALPAAARGSWKTLGASAIELRVTDGARTLAARLTIAGDSINGVARSSAAGESATATGIRGRRASCSAP
jgi:anti-sigma factor RsiW